MKYSLHLLIIFILTCVSCSNDRKKNDINSPYNSLLIKKKIDRLIETEKDTKFIDIYVFEKEKTFIVVFLSEMFDINWYNISFPYKDKYIIHYGGFDDLLATKYIDLSKFNRSDSSKCEDLSKYIVDPNLPHMFIVQNDSIVEIIPESNDWILFDQFYFEKYKAHAYLETHDLPDSCSAN